MTPEKILEFQRNVTSALINRPGSAFEYFKKEWGNLEPAYRKIASVQVLKLCNSYIENDSFSSMPEDRQRVEIYKITCSFISAYIENDLSGKPDTPTLKIGPKTSLKDIAVIFKLMHDLKYIKNSHPDIERFIKSSFNLPEKSTIFSYLENPKELEIALLKLKNKIAKITFEKETDLT